MSSKYRLLVVDDNAATRYALRRTLERHGFEIQEAGTGNGGLAMINAGMPDALILDINLPDISGFDIVRKLRSDPRTALLPVIHVSAASIETGDLINGLDAGADAYLIHPINPDVLLATLRTLLRVRDTEAALRESEARFREIFANIAAPVAVIDAALTVHESNHAFARLVRQGGYASKLYDCFAPGQDDALAELRHRLETRERWRGTLRLVIAGELRETEWRVEPYRRPDFGILFVEDITEQRQRERDHLELLDTATAQLAREVEEREHTEALLIQAQKMDALGKLTGGIAHDFNNLLTGIITGVEIISQRIQEGRLDGVQRIVNTVLGSAQRAAALTHRLLAFSRQQPLDARSVDINKNVLSLEDLLRRTIGERIRLKMDLAPTPTIARVDPNQLENAVLNLVINARDALSAGGDISISTSSARIHRDSQLADGMYVSVSVRDNGTGIDPAMIDKVFDPFFTTKPMGQGTGLGLSMIYGFARQSGGHARIRSRLGEGTEVTILLPTSEVPPQSVVRQAPAPSDGQGEHILLVEDTATVRELTAELLTGAGYQCTEVGDVETALQILQADAAIDLLLTDIGLPGMNGRELADTARHWRPELPVLFMTGYAPSALERDSFLGNNMDLITKPYELQALLRRVRMMIRSC